MITVDVEPPPSPRKEVLHDFKDGEVSKLVGRGMGIDLKKNVYCIHVCFNVEDDI